MGLALANAATHQSIDNFVLLDDLDVFGSNEPANNFMGGGILGLNL